MAIKTASGGHAEVAGFTVSNSTYNVLGFSLEGATIPAGKGILLLLEVEENSDKACLGEIIFSSSGGTTLDNRLLDCTTIVIGPITGCTNFDACNFNSQADIDDGSCNYGITCWDGDIVCNPLDCAEKADYIYDNSWAVIIGIDKYKDFDQLDYAVEDAESVKDMLITKFDFHEDNIKYLVNEEATLKEIKLALDDIAKSAEANDRIIVFYSGHGETIRNKDGSETGYIIPVEGNKDKLYATGLAMDEILRICQMSDAKHMLFLMDACYSGLMTQQYKGLANPTEEGYITKVANESARQIITAGGDNEQVIERDEWQHSAFTKNLLTGLDGWEADYDSDGYITADELGTYLRISVTEDSDNLQTPQKGRFKNSGGGEFVFIRTDAINLTYKRNKKTILSQTESKLTEKIDLLTKAVAKLKSEVIKGCMDSDACNYKWEASIEGWCDYSCKKEKGRYEISLEDYNTFDSTLALYIRADVEICGMQFDFIGAEVNKNSGGIFEEYGWQVSSKFESTLGLPISKWLAFSMEGTCFEANMKTNIINLKVQNIQRDKLCLLDVIVAGKKGHELKSLFDEKVCYTIAN